MLGGTGLNTTALAPMRLPSPTSICPISLAPTPMTNVVPDAWRAAPDTEVAQRHVVIDGTAFSDYRLWMDYNAAEMMNS